MIKFPLVFSTIIVAAIAQYALAAVPPHGPGTQDPVSPTPARGGGDQKPVGSGSATTNGADTATSPAVDQWSTTRTQILDELETKDLPVIAERFGITIRYLKDRIPKTDAEAAAIQKVSENRAAIKVVQDKIDELKKKGPLSDEDKATLQKGLKKIADYEAKVSAAAQILVKAETDRLTKLAADANAKPEELQAAIEAVIKRLEGKYDESPPSSVSSPSPSPTTATTGDPAKIKQANDIKTAVDTAITEAINAEDAANSFQALLTKALDSKIPAMEKQPTVTDLSQKVQAQLGKKVEKLKTATEQANARLQLILGDDKADDKTKQQAVEEFSTTLKKIFQP